MRREIPLYTLDGVKDAQVRTYSFATEDKLGLSMLRFTRERGRRGDAGRPRAHHVDGHVHHARAQQPGQLPARPRVRRLVPGLPDEQPALLQPVPEPLHDGRHRALRLPAGPRGDATRNRRHADPRHLPLPGRGFVHDEPVRQGRRRHHQRHRQQRGADAARAGLVEGEAADGPRPGRDRAGTALPQPDVERGPRPVAGEAVLENGLGVPPRVRRPGLPHAEPDVGHGLARALQPRKARRDHPRTRRRPVRRDEHALLPPRAEDGQSRAGREDGARRPHLRPAAGRLFPVRRATSRRRCFS